MVCYYICQTQSVVLVLICSHKLDVSPLRTQLHFATKVIALSTSFFLPSLPVPCGYLDPINLILVLVCPVFCSSTSSSLECLFWSEMIRDVSNTLLSLVLLLNFSINAYAFHLCCPFFLVCTKFVPCLHILSQVTQLA